MKAHALDPHFYPQGPRSPLMLLTMLLCIALCTAPTARAQGKYATLVDSLDAVQQRAAMNAAPRGNDEPLTPVVIQADITSVGTTEVVEPSQLELFAEQNQGPLDLEIEQRDQSVRDELELFGYDIFNRVPSTFAPVDGIPVPEGYVIGPGDNLVVQLYGNRNVEYNLVVTRDGDILIPEYGPVSVAGMVFDEAERLLSEGFERRVIGARAVVTMGKLRTIQIRLAGDVVQPGIYTIGGLSTFIDALLTTGGVAQTGSLRNVQLIRGGKVAARLDLYELLLSGNSAQDPFLKHNDTIFVPPIGEVVYIGGEVQRPAIYELKSESTIGDVIGMAGGMLPTAALMQSHLERVSSEGNKRLLDFSFATKASVVKQLAVQSGDFIRVLPLEDELKEAVLVSGQVRRPGAYQFRESMVVSDLIPSAAALMPEADLDYALVTREDPITLLSQVHFVRLAEAMTNKRGAEDITLSRRDEVLVFSRQNSRSDAVADIVSKIKRQASARAPAQVFSAIGHIRHEGTYPLAADAHLTDVLGIVGGPLEGVDMHYGVIARTQHPGTDVILLPFSIAAATQPGTIENPVIASGDRVYVFSEDTAREPLLAEELTRLQRQARYGEQEQTVTVLGETRFAGVYPLTGDMRASDLLCASGGLARKAYGVTAELSRIVQDEMGLNSAVHTQLDPAVLLGICRLKREAEQQKIDRVEYLNQYLNNHINPVLESMDQLAFREKIGWVERMTVTLSGEVVTPGVYAVDRGETLCEVVNRAGGLTPAAYSFGGVFTRQSIKSMQQEVIDGLKAQLDDLMINLSLSHSFNNQEKSSHEWAGKQDYLRTIRQIETAQASGRMVVDLEKAIECDEFANIVLEDGDALHIPVQPNYVQVAGQVYVPTSHLFQKDRDIEDYIELSGGHTILGELSHAYVIQANGEVLNYRGSRKSSRIKRNKVSPGARVYVPIDVDRMNTTEKAQTWVQTLINSALIAGVIL